MVLVLVEVDARLGRRFGAGGGFWGLGLPCGKAALRLCAPLFT